MRENPPDYLIGFGFGPARNIADAPRPHLASAYGAAGALIVILLRVYYSAQIFLLGAELTKAYSDIGGAEEKPRGETAGPLVRGT